MPTLPYAQNLVRLLLSRLGLNTIDILTTAPFQVPKSQVRPEFDEGHKVRKHDIGPEIGGGPLDCD